jgi:hypothetical protein
MCSSENVHISNLPTDGQIWKVVWHTPNDGVALRVAGS